MMTAMGGSLTRAPTLPTIFCRSLRHSIYQLRRELLIHQINGVKGPYCIMFEEGPNLSFAVK